MRVATKWGKAGIWLLWALWLVLLLCNYSFVAVTQGLFPPASLRYTSGLSAQQAEGARKYAQAHPGQAMWMTFWRQQQAQLESELRTWEGQGLFYTGQGWLVWPAAFESGGWPGDGEDFALVVSSGLAHSLWGSADVVGKTLRMGRQSYVVKGVFTEEKPLFAASAPLLGNESWQAVELQGLLPGNPQAQGKEFAQASGLGLPDHVVLGGGLSAVSRLLFWFPVGLALAAFWLQGLAQTSRKKRWLLAGGMLLLGFLLWGLLSLPEWMQPGKWSDFAYWKNLGLQLAQQGRDFLALPPAARDVQGKIALLLQAGTAFAASLWLLVLQIFTPRENQETTVILYNS